MLKMTKIEKINGRQHITYSENSDQVEEMKKLLKKRSKSVSL